MTPQELKEYAESGSYVILTLPRKPSGQRMRLTQSHGPTGEILNCRGSKTTVRFRSDSVLRFLKKHKLA